MSGCGSSNEKDGVQGTAETVELEASLFSDLAPGSGSQESETLASSEAKEDWSGKYEHYFEEHPMMNKIMEVSMEQYGNKVFLRFAFGQTEDVLYVKYAVWESEGKKELDTSEENNYCTLYFTKDGDAYLETVMKGKKTEYQKTSGVDWQNAGHLSQTDKPMGIDNDMLDEITYDREETIDGVVYDVLYAKSLMQTQSKANRWVKNYFYINRATQELELYQMKDTVVLMDCRFYPLDMEAVKEVPAEMKAGKKIKEEEFASRYALAIVKITYNSMGYDPDKYNLEEALGLK